MNCGLSQGNCVTISPAYQPARPRMRNLGAAILLAAVQDYRSMDEDSAQGCGTVSLSANTRVAGPLRLGSFAGRWTEPGVAAGFAGPIQE